MKGSTKQIMLGHGSGGRQMHDLVRNLFARSFSNPVLNHLSDAAVFSLPHGTIAFTTDTFVVSPVFFPGGDIGKLAVCGTVNDLAASGAKPLFLSAGFVLEEGLPLETLETIVESMAGEARDSGVSIVCGDTKVVEKGKCDKIFINTSGIGVIPHEQAYKGTTSLVRVGDKIVLSGFIGDHGMSVLAARNDASLSINFESDCASLNKLTGEILDKVPEIRFMRDPTRGGLATTLCELAEAIGLGILIHEEKIPVRPGVKGLCELFGFDPLYVANEGKMVIIVGPESSETLTSLLAGHLLGRGAAVIGEITASHKRIVRMKTGIGGTRIVNMLSGEQLPRIC
jgi:hydrogenase expression/formation protein HypE